MALYLFRLGDGNEGNFPRIAVDIPEDGCPFTALHALVVTRYIPGCTTRRHVMRELTTEGEREYGITGTVYEGPSGETAFEAAWLTCKLQPMTEDEWNRSRTVQRHTLREALDSAAWRFYVTKKRMSK